MKKIVLILSIMAGLNARAQEAEVLAASEPSTANQSLPSKPQPTSADRRAEQRWGVVGQLGNITVGNRDTTGMGVGVSHYLSGQDELSFEAGAGTNYRTFSSILGDSVSGSDRRMGAYYKKFTGNTFYLKTGIQVDHVDYKVTHHPFFWGNITTQEASIDLYSLYLGIGNHWQLRRFTIGCDWAAIVVPFAHANFSESNSAPGASSNWDLKQRLTAVGGVVTRFYIGMGF